MGQASAWEWLATRVSEDPGAGIRCRHPAGDFFLDEEFYESRDGSEVLIGSDGTAARAVTRCAGAVVDGHLSGQQQGGVCSRGSWALGSCIQP